MKAPVAGALAAVLVVLVCSVPSTARDRGGTPAPLSTGERPQIAIPDPSLVLHGGPANGSAAKAVADSFNLYGGVKVDGTNDRRPEGQFQDFILFPKDQGWFGVDLTENPTFWHVDTFNASNLDTLTGNRAMWSGVAAGTSGFTTAPGYGNNWNDVLQWIGQTNPTINTTVRWSFDFNHDTEPGYDFFIVEYDSGGTWIPVLTVDGTNKDASGVFGAPVHFDQTVTYTPLMYTGQPATDVRLRLRVVSDGAWSDEDGLWPTKGAAQVDNIRVWFNGVLVTQNGDDGIATFEDLGGVDDTEGWSPVSAAFAGDFAKVLPQLRDIDPGRTNLTPQLGFIDDGTPPSNSSISTGGSVSANWSYGVRGNWVVNFNGGVSFGLVPLNNEFRSPEIAWDDTTTTEEDALVGGAFMRFSIWQHLPLDNGIFWVWNVRSHKNNSWSSWQNRNFVYYGGGVANYVNVQTDVTDLLTPDPDKVQMSLGVVDLADLFGFSGTDATPSPTFDNVSFWRYNLSGPTFSTRNIDLFQDSFPQGGSIDYATDPSALSVRLDMARDVSTGTFNVPGDSIVVDVTATIPGTTLAGMPQMKWILDANPLFDGVRSLPPGATNLGPGPKGWSRWMGTVTGDSARTAAGVAVAGRFFFDAPNDGPANASASYQTAEPAMFFPGDRFRYFIESTDSGGNTTSLPADTTGFMAGVGYDRVFTVRALPSLVSDGLGGTQQPGVLVINDFGHRGGENDFLSAFGQNGLFEDTDFDTYTVQGPSSLVSNGIGSAGAHGANAQQLAGYDTILYLSGNLSSGLLSDGTNLNGNDKGDDLTVLTQWHQQTANRHAVYFGDDLCTSLATSPAGLTYLSTVMGVDVISNDVRSELGNRATPVVRATSSFATTFGTDFVAFGGCLGINQFDSIRPIAAASTAHEFIDESGTAFTPSASVWYERTENLNGTDYQRVDLTFPYGFLYIYNPINAKTPVNTSARSFLIADILNAFGHGTNPGSATGNGELPRRFAVEDNVPNPFNPSTTLAFSAPSAGRVEVRVYNLRGELVRTLLDGEVEAGRHALVWDGTDGRGAAVSSGVYLYEVRGFGERITRKMALVK